MSSTIATTRQQQPAGALAIASDQQEFTAAQLEAFGIAKASRGEQLVFLHTVQRTGLDPAARQIYGIIRGGKLGIQTGIDGFRLIARRAADRRGETISYDDTEWCSDDGQWRDVWLTQGPPIAARVVVHRNGERFSATALTREYKQPGDMWSKMPANQIAKCAEALALRKAFPQELAGIYTDDEMGSTAPAARPVASRSAFAKPADDGVVDAEVVDETGELIDPLGNQMKRLHATFRQAGLTERDDCLTYASTVVGRDVTSTSELTVHEASRVIDDLMADPGYQREAGQ